MIGDTAVVGKMLLLRVLAKIQSKSYSTTYTTSTLFIKPSPQPKHTHSEARNTDNESNLKRCILNFSGAGGQ